MEIITKIFDFDFATLVPDLSPILDNVVTIMRVAILAGPILLLVMGLMYLLIVPKEANHWMGYRTYFGMGSVQAWNCTQKIAGYTFSGLGLVLLIVMLVVSGSFAKMEQNQLVTAAAKSLLWQAGLVILARLVVSLAVTILFDRKGERRK
ncbi:MAG: SdpI family protein [Oscillospiraceae bacterium]|nr:SdpI family protein [Oscillospiraceae bacterium]